MTPEYLKNVLDDGIYNLVAIARKLYVETPATFNLAVVCGDLDPKTPLLRATSESNLAQRLPNSLWFSEPGIAIRQALQYSGGLLLLGEFGDVKETVKNPHGFGLFLHPAYAQYEGRRLFRPTHDGKGSYELVQMAANY